MANCEHCGAENIDPGHSWHHCVSELRGRIDALEDEAPAPEPSKPPAPAAKPATPPTKKS